MDIRAIIKREPLEEKNGVFYFDRPPADVVPARDAAPTDKRSWSFWRKENYAFLEREMARLEDDKTRCPAGREAKKDKRTG